jgi:hypothetical protein
MLSGLFFHRCYYFSRYSHIQQPRFDPLLPQLFLHRQWNHTTLIRLVIRETSVNNIFHSTRLVPGFYNFVQAVGERQANLQVKERSICVIEGEEDRVTTSFSAAVERTCSVFVRK